MIFEKKKIQSETLSEYLNSIRSNLKLSPVEVSGKTGISLKFLTAMEKGDFKILPADVYVFGFLKQLANLYAVDPLELIEQYKKERGIQKQLVSSPSLLNRGWRKKFFRRLIITPKILSLAVGLAFVALSIGYIAWQVWSINKTPNLQIFEPADNAVIKNSFVQIRGKTDPGISVSVNGQSIFVDSQGGFQAQLGLSPGPETFTISAKNSFNKSVSQTLNITGVSDSQATTSQLQLK